MNPSPFTTRFLFPSLAFGLGLLFLAATARAVPYASQVTKSGNTVSFVLNHAASGITVLRDGGNPVTPPIDASTPGVKTFDMTGYTSYQIIVTGMTAVGWTQYVPDGTDRNFYLPRGVCINKNPASTNFGKVYVSESRGGTTMAGRPTIDGIYILRADGAAFSGPHTGGLTWTWDGTAASAPLRGFIGPDDHLYVVDLYRDYAFEFNDDLSVATQLIDDSNRTSAQWVHSIYVEGTQAAGNRKIYLVNGNYNDTARKGLIMYDLGANAAATPSDTGTQVIGPGYFAYYGYDVLRDSNGDWYMNNYRGLQYQAAPIVKFNGANPWPLNRESVIWEATNFYYYAESIDLYEPAGLVAYGHYNFGGVLFFKMSDGSYVQTLAAGNRIRDLAFDAAGNLVTVDNSLEYARFWSPGGYTVAITSSDGTFQVIKPATEVSVTATDPNASEAGPDTGTFTITRVGNTSDPLTVNYTLSGTASNGVDYVTLSGSVTIPAGESSATVVVTPVDDSVAEFTETVILTLAPSPNYSVTPPSSATVTITDNEMPTIDLAVVFGSMYERLAYDYVRLRVVRRGDTNAPAFFVNLGYSGAATPNVDFTPNPGVWVDPGAVNVNFELNPLDDTLLEGNETLTVTVASGSGYVIGTNSPSVNATILDDELPPETVLFADNFNTDTSAHWALFYASTNSTDFDYTAAFAYDYSLQGIPAAPRSAGDTLGLYIQVNKDGTPNAAAVNLYPLNKSFAGDYALRFDMYMLVGTGATTEYALFGINHSGTKTNWFRNNTGGVGPGWTFDGLFYGVEADAAALGDYVIYSSPTTAGNNPTPLTPGRNASTLTGTFKAPPFAFAGAPSNPNFSSTPCWVDVEVSQIGPVVTLKMNQTVIFSYTNATPYTSGNIMIGYVDAYDSIGSSWAGVVYDNVRVVSLAPPTITITQVKIVGSNVEISFAGPAADPPSAFVLQESSVVTPASAYTDVSATITGGGGSYKAVRALGSAPKFYRIKRP